MTLPSRRIGKMRYLVDVNAYAKTSDGVGGRTNILVSFGKAYAELMTPNTRELKEAEKLQVVIDKLLIMRYAPSHEANNLFSDAIFTLGSRTFVSRHGFCDDLKRFSYFYCKEEQPK